MTLIKGKKKSIPKKRITETLSGGDKELPMLVFWVVTPRGLVR
jgi:hypothetical protein